MVKKYKLEKIKTIGDAYMVVGNLTYAFADHCDHIADLALEMLTEIHKDIQTEDGDSIQLRIGIHLGPATAGVIGTSKFSFDIWGDTINTASRMESHGKPGKIQVSEDIYRRLKADYDFIERGVVDVKGKGQMKTYFLNGRKIS